jgi:hypothetical protein
MNKNSQYLEEGIGSLRMKPNYWMCGKTKKVAKT